jgi:hypothetical protein
MPIGGRAAALRLQVETALSGRVAAPLEYRDRSAVERVSAGIREIDELTGGLPRGCMTEIFGEACTGRTSLLLAALAARTQDAEICALVDGRDAFDPESALLAGVNLRQLLWIRCKNADQALRATDLLIQGGGFGMIALDLSDIAPRSVRQVPLNVWFRFRRAVESTQTILFLMAQESNAKTCASLVLQTECGPSEWRATSEEKTENAGQPEGCLLHSIRNGVKVTRMRTSGEQGQAQPAMPRPVLSINARSGGSPQQAKRADGMEFESETGWSYTRRQAGWGEEMRESKRVCGGREKR